MSYSAGNRVGAHFDVFAQPALQDVPGGVPSQHRAKLGERVGEMAQQEGPGRMLQVLK